MKCSIRQDVTEVQYTVKVQTQKSICAWDSINCTILPSGEHKNIILLTGLNFNFCKYYEHISGE